METATLANDSHIEIDENIKNTRYAKHNVKIYMSVLTGVALLILIAITILAAIYVPQVAIYVPIIALALAFALQKYTANFFAYFVISFSGIYTIGDRIRIGSIKGDVWRIGLLNTVLEEVGEDEKLGGELTGRLLYVPNLIVLDQPVLNYSKDYSGYESKQAIASDYIFDEVRIPVTTDSDIKRACQILESIVKKEDEVYIKEAGQVFHNGYPRFLGEAIKGSRVLVYIEPQHVWIKGKFVAPLRGRNDLKSRILLRFVQEIAVDGKVNLA
jgi:small-conductance mechanosensitive channel